MRRPAAALVLVAAILPPTKRQTLSVKALIYYLILVFIHSGCGTSPKSSPSPEERATFGTVGVSRAFYLPETAIGAYANGPLAGAGEGAVTASWSILRAGFNSSSFATSGDPWGFIVYWGLVGAASIIALPVGAVVGAIKAMPVEVAVSSEILVREILERTSPQEDLQDELLRAGAAETEQQLVLVDEVGPTTVDNVATYDSLAEKGIHTVLEASVERIALGAVETGSDPPLALILEGRSRLIRVGDGTVVSENKYRDRSLYWKFGEWAVDNAALLHREYEDVLRNLAVAIIRWNFVSRD